MHKGKVLPVAKKEMNKWMILVSRFFLLDLSLLGVKGFIFLGTVQLSCFEVSSVLVETT